MCIDGLFKWHVMSWKNFPPNWVRDKLYMDIILIIHLCHYYLAIVGLHYLTSHTIHKWTRKDFNKTNIMMAKFRTQEVN